MTTCRPPKKRQRNTPVTVLMAEITPEIVSIRAAAFSQSCAYCGAEPWKPCRHRGKAWRSYCSFCNQLGGYGIHDSRWKTTSSLVRLAWAAEAFEDLPRICFGRSVDHLSGCPKMFNARAVEEAFSQEELRRTTYQRILREGMAVCLVPSSDAIKEAFLRGGDAQKELYAEYGISME